MTAFLELTYKAYFVFHKDVLFRLFRSIDC
jgi:hypothetical protein